MIANKDQLKPYLDNNAHLIPLNIWNKQTKDKKGKVTIRGKTPLYNDWTKSDKNTDKVLKLIEKSYNVGYRLLEDDLIIDIDHRNFGDVESLVELCKFLGVDDIANKCPTVITGSGGFHYYMTKPAGVNIRETIERFPGIEFKTIGRQVVTAGSKHPNGNYYGWDELSPELNERPKAPKKLLELLQYETPKNQSSGGDINNNQLSRLLEQLDISNYGDNDSWFKILCASHHGTGGTGIEEFLAWSLDDLEYADDEHLIRCRWASLGEKLVTITVNSLYKEVLAYGGNTAVITASEEFEDFAKEAENVNEEFDDIVTQQEVTSTYKSGIALDIANALHPSSNDEDIVTAIRAALQSGVIEQIKAFGVIQTTLKWTKGQLNDVIKKIKDRIIDDLGRVLAEKTMELKFHNKKGLIWNTNGQFWIYSGKYWGPVTKEFVGKKITEVLDDMRKKVDIDVKENALVTESLGIIGRLSAVNSDILRLKERPYPVINCTNGELWLKDNGETRLRKHKSSSYLLQVLNVDYSPGAGCPIFDKAIRHTFSNFDDAEDIVRHFEEYMGYVLHPDKYPAKWWLFKGPGGDGKTTLMKILSALLGDAVLPESIDNLKGGSGGDNHAFADLPGKLLVYDDDMKKNSVLPDGILKKLSEDGQLTANPKGAGKFKFVKVCTVTMLSNGYPKTNDLTRGFRRRAAVIPFNMAFHEKGGIHDIDNQIIENELGGVLNRALQGLQRLRARGDFKEPYSCQLAREEWLSESNTVALFTNEQIELTGKNKDIENLSDMYTCYNDWCVTYGINKVDTKQQFRGILEDMGIWYGKLAGNVAGFRGIKINRVNIDDFDEE